MAERRQLSSHEIIARYKKGERDFSNVDCFDADFIGMKLTGIIFKNARLEYAGFEETDLTGADFTNCNLQWSSLRHANLTRANFTGANISYSILNDAIFDKTIMRNTNLSWSLLFNVNLHAADVTGADIATIATHPSQITKAGVELVKARLAQLKHKLPYDLWFILNNSVNRNAYEAQKAQRLGIGERKKGYEIGKVGYGGFSLEQGTQSEHVYLGRGKKLTYGVSKHAYKREGSYGR